MTAKRTRHVMLRLTDAEYARLDAAKPSGEELAAFARRTLLGALGEKPVGDIRGAAAFVVAALSAEITFEQALDLFDDHVPAPTEEVSDGRGE